MVFRLSIPQRRVLAVAALVVGTGVLAACSSGPAPTDPDDGGLQTVDVAVLPTSNMAAVYLGVQEGYFEEEGLDLNLTTVGGGAEMIAGLQANSFDFLAVGYVPLFAAAANGLPIVMVAGNDAGGATADEEWQVVVAGGDSSIETVEDLAGATIGVNALKGVAEATIRASMREQDVDDSAVQFVEVPFPEVPAAIANGTIDAGFATEPFLTLALADGARIVDTPSLVLGKNFPNGVWATSSTLVDDDPDMVAAFTRAITKSLEFAAGNPDAVREILPTYTSLTPELAAEIRQPIFTADLDRTQLQKLIDICVEFGAIPSAPDLDALIVSP